MSRVSDKIKIVEEFIAELEEIMPENFEEYFRRTEKRLACRKAFENIIESVNDLAILVIKEKRLPLPSEDEKAFEILGKAKIISDNLSANFLAYSDPASLPSLGVVPCGTKGMRNFLVHRYEQIDDELVYEAITNEILKDAEEFIKRVEETIKP